MSDLRYSDAAIAVLADFNNVEPDFMRKFWPNASNPYMLNWLEKLGERKSAGLPIYSEPGRLLVPEQLK